MPVISNFYSEHILLETPERKDSLSLSTKEKLKDAIFSTNSAIVQIIDTRDKDKQHDEEAFLDLERTAARGHDDAPLLQAPQK